MVCSVDTNYYNVNLQVSSIQFIMHGVTKEDAILFTLIFGILSYNTKRKKICSKLAPASKFNFGICESNH